MTAEPQDPGPDGPPAGRCGPPAGASVLPADSHVHTEFSWDTDVGDMAATCARAAQIGLPAVAFTEHLDLTAWVVTPEEARFIPEHIRHHVPEGGGTFRAPALDVDGYLAAVEECRERFPGLTILSGLEIGEPHWHPEAVEALLSGGRFDRVLGSLHSLQARGSAADIFAMQHERGADRAMRDYLAEAYALASSSAPVAVLAHVDYPARAWQHLTDDPFDPLPFEDEYREVLRALAASGRALEVNTSLPMPPAVLRWWHESGGTAITFGSDAHLPDVVARGFADAAATARACGFRPGPAPADPWRRD